MAMTWRGPIAPLDRKDGAGRVVPIKDVDNDVRKLPLPLMYQPANWGGHNGAVRVGTLDRVWIEQSPRRMLWGEGRFNDRSELARTVFDEVDNKFARHVSVDLDPGTKKLMGVTIVSCPAFEEAEIAELFRTDDEDAPVDLVDRMDQLEPVAFSVTAPAEGHLEWSMEDPDPLGTTTLVFAAAESSGIPIADRGRAWDSGAAEKRISEWAEGDATKLARAYMYRDPQKDARTRSAYKLPYTDIIDGKLTVIPQAVIAVAAALQGARGGVDISEEAKARIRSKVAGLYKKINRDLDTDLTPPWDDEARAIEAEVFAAHTQAEVIYQRHLQGELVAEAETFNWVDDVGGLPSYIKRISKHLRRKGMSESHAIATAVNAAKKMCATGDLNWPGLQNVNPGSRAEACASVADWERKKAQARTT